MATETLAGSKKPFWSTGAGCDVIECLTRKAFHLRQGYEGQTLEQIQKVQAEVWQALRIADLQKIYNSARESLPDRARALLDPLEDLSSKILLSRNDLNRFLRQWENLREKIHERRFREGEAARHWLDEMYNIQASIRLGDRIYDWHEAYARLRHSLARTLAPVNRTGPSDRSG